VTKRAVDLPVLIGSGVTSENVENYTKASALIVGSHFKSGGVWYNSVCSDRVNNFMKKVRTLGL